MEKEMEMGAKGRDAQRGQMDKTKSLWDPDATSKKSVRSQGRPRQRWDDEIQRFIDATMGSQSCHWIILANDARLWSELGDIFLEQKRPKPTIRRSKRSEQA